MNKQFKYKVGQTVWLNLVDSNYDNYIGPAKIGSINTSDYPCRCYIPHHTFSNGNVEYPIRESEIQYVVFDDE